MLIYHPGKTGCYRTYKNGDKVTNLCQEKIFNPYKFICYRSFKSGDKAVLFATRPKCDNTIIVCNVMSPATFVGCKICRSREKAFNVG